MVNQAKAKQYELTDYELDLIGASLGKEPYQQVYGLIQKLSDQFKKQKELACTVGSTSDTVSSISTSKVSLNKSSER